MRRVLIFGALLLPGVDAVLHRRGSNSTFAAQGALSQHVAAADQSLAMQACSSLMSELWSDLVLQADKPVVTNFDKGDKAVKDKFIKNCVVVFDNDVDHVVQAQCAKAGGTLMECKKMAKDQKAARKAKKLKPWCDKTFDFFAAKTKPRCLAKCRALLCKDRCKLNDEINDKSDKVAAYQIKLDTVAKKEKRLKKAAAAQKVADAKADKLDKTMCIPAGKNVTTLAASEKKIGKELGVLQKAAKKASSENDKALAAQKKVKANKKAKKADKSKVDAACKKTSGAFKAARAKQMAKNKKLIDVQGKVTKAKSIQKFQCQKVKDMKKAGAKARKQNAAELKAVVAKKKELKDSQDEVKAEKNKMGTALRIGLKAA